MIVADATERAKIFISYSHRDSANFAEELAAGLDLAGFSPLLDRQDIFVGEDWEARLSRLIAQSDAVVFVVSPQAVKSERCRWEIKRALKLSKRLVPVIFKDVPLGEVPETVSRLQFVRFETSHSFAKSLASLREALRVDISWIREHTRLADLALRWRSRGVSQALLLRGDDLAAAETWVTNRRPGAPEITEVQSAFLKASRLAEDLSLSRERAQLRRILGLAIIIVLLLCALGFPTVYREYVLRAANECDLLAAEQDNDVHVPGVEFDKIDVERAIPACQRAVTADPQNPRLLHNLGRSLDRAGRYREAVSQYAQATSLGNAWSMNNLGVMYLHARGTDLDVLHGVRLLRAAAQQNNPQALINYLDTDFMSLFEEEPLRKVLQRVLTAKGYLPTDATEVSNDTLRAAVENFKSATGIGDKSVSLRVLDRLGVLDALSRDFTGLN
jgi:TPR repeat protein